MKNTLTKFVLLVGLITSWNLAFAETTKVKIKTSKGDITLELDQKKAPLTVANFMQYSQDGFYTNTVFHRIIKNFMIQGGGMDENMEKKETREAIKNEAENGLKNLRGTIAMARTNDPHSATSQFFINHKDNDFLDHPGRSGSWGYCVFGKVVEGMKVVDAIANTATATKNGRANVPLEPVVVYSVTEIIPVIEGEGISPQMETQPGEVDGKSLNGSEAAMDSSPNAAGGVESAQEKIVGGTAKPLDAKKGVGE